ncbi:hypothetical protein PT286_06380 [Neisseriaceae bacterium ESL0693]|nr:hypothetical protein [Neisseriaceae bacterium ESL0693]
MITVKGQLIYGIECDGRLYRDYVVKPLTLANELDAIEMLEADEQYADYAQTRRTIVDTLAFWTQQLSFDGLKKDKLTVEWLMNGLTSEDYQAILASLGELHEKSLAAGRTNDTAAPGQSSSEATDAVTNTTGKPV